MANKNAKPKNPRARALVSLVAILLVVAVCGYVALFGIGKGTMINYLKPWGEAISLVMTCAAACTPCMRLKTTAASTSRIRWAPPSPSSPAV